MLVAIDKATGARALATPRAEAYCPLCGEDVIPKCGHINAWHWAHKPASLCEHGQGDTYWSLAWKMFFPVDQIEIPVTVGGKTRIADIVTDHGKLIRLEQGATSVSEIIDWERFCNVGGYSTIWLPNLLDLAGLDLRLKADGYATFRWKHARKSLGYCKHEVYCDVGDNMLFNLKKLHPGPPCGGWGYIVELDRFVNSVGGFWSRGFDDMRHLRKDLAQISTTNQLLREAEDKTTEAKHRNQEYRERQRVNIANTEELLRVIDWLIDDTFDPHGPELDVDYSGLSLPAPKG